MLLKLNKLFCLFMLVRPSQSATKQPEVVLCGSNATTTITCPQQQTIFVTGALYSKISDSTAGCVRYNFDAGCGNYRTSTNNIRRNCHAKNTCGLSTASSFFGYQVPCAGPYEAQKYFLRVTYLCLTEVEWAQNWIDICYAPDTIPQDSPGLIFSPFYPYPYVHNFDCTVNFKGEQGQYLNFTLLETQLNNVGGSCLDNLRIDANHYCASRLHDFVNQTVRIPLGSDGTLTFEFISQLRPFSDAAATVDGQLLFRFDVQGCVAGQILLADNTEVARTDCSEVCTSALIQCNHSQPDLRFTVANETGVLTCIGPQRQWSRNSTAYCSSSERCVDPGSPPNGLRRRMDSVFRLNTPVTFSCDDGYILRGASQIVCIRGAAGVLVWDSPRPVCDGPVVCADPGRLVNGVSSSTTANFSIGTRILYQCNVGFQLTGSAAIYCGFDRDRQIAYWNDTTTACRVPPPRCTQLANLTNGQRRFSDNLLGLGTIVVSTCFSRYELEGGNSTIRCIVSNVIAVWDGPAAFCVGPTRCVDPPIVEFASRSTNDSSYSVGTVIQFTCRNNRTLRPNTPALSCVRTTDDAVWNSSAPVCVEPTSCPPLLPISNGNWNNVNGTFPVGSSATFQCGWGYLPRPTNQISCVIDAASGYSVWSPPDVSCIGPVACFDPGDLQNGQIIDEFDGRYVLGVKLRFQCNFGYRLIGLTEIVCQHSTVQQNVTGWSGSLPTCLKYTNCSDPNPTPFRGGTRTVIDNKFLLNSTVNYTCTDGLTLIGNDTIRCILNNAGQPTWYPTIPGCVKDLIAVGSPTDRQTGLPFLTELLVGCAVAFLLIILISILCGYLALRRYRKHKEVGMSGRYDELNNRRGIFLDPLGDKPPTSPTIDPAVGIVRASQLPAARVQPQPVSMHSAADNSPVKAGGVHSLQQQGSFRASLPITTPLEILEETDDVQIVRIHKKVLAKNAAPLVNGHVSPPRLPPALPPRRQEPPVMVNQRSSFRDAIDRQVSPSQVRPSLPPRTYRTLQRPAVPSGPPAQQRATSFRVADSSYSTSVETEASSRGRSGDSPLGSAGRPAKTVNFGTPDRNEHLRYGSLRRSGDVSPNFVLQPRPGWQPARNVAPSPSMGNAVRTSSATQPPAGGHYQRRLPQSASFRHGSVNPPLPQPPGTLERRVVSVRTDY